MQGSSINSYSSFLTKKIIKKFNCQIICVAPFFLATLTAFSISPRDALPVEIINGFLVTVTFFIN